MNFFFCSKCWNNERFTCFLIYERNCCSGEWHGPLTWRILPCCISIAILIANHGGSFRLLDCECFRTLLQAQALVSYMGIDGFDCTAGEYLMTFLANFWLISLLWACFFLIYLSTSEKNKRENQYTKRDLLHKGIKFNTE